MKKLMISGMTVLALIGSAQAGDAELGKMRAAACSSCHGPTGVSRIPIYPNLAGQKEQYLFKAMKAYQDGTRNDPMMKPLVTTLTDADISNLAAYYASLSPTGE